MINPIRKHIPLVPGKPLSLKANAGLTGFGVHFAPFKLHDAWKLRVENSSVGLTSYAQSQIFSLGRTHYRIWSKGDETVSLAPDDKGNLVVTIVPEHPGRLERIRQPKKPPYSLPHWARDYWFSTPWTRMSWASMTSDQQQAQKLHADAKVWLLDAGWASNTAYLGFDPKKFPHGDDTLKYNTDAGMQTILWIAPWVQKHEPIWEEFDRRGWFVKDALGKSLLFATTGDGQYLGSYLDYSKEDFVSYYRERINALIDLGARGFMFDFGEALPDGAVFALETADTQAAHHEHLTGHNWYVDASKRVLYEACRNRDVAIITRSGWNESYRYSALWLGDQSSDSSRFAGLNSLMWGYKTALESGYRDVGMDVGGYFGTPSVSDYRHWLDLSVLMPFSMLHGMNHASPWEFGAEQVDYFNHVRRQHRSLWQSGHRHKLPSFELSSDGQNIRSIKLGKYEFRPNKSS